jgi:hypothetical protein
LKEIRSSFVVLVVLLLPLCANAQIRSVTNSDIEKYRQDRLREEKEYRENYERLGMPSPEEIDRRVEESQAELEQLSAKFRQDDEQRERLAAQTRSYRQLSVTYVYSSAQPYSPYWNDVIWSGAWRRPRFFRRPYVTNGLNGYVGGGQFWPAPGSRQRFASGYVGGGQLWPGSSTGAPPRR